MVDPRDITHQHHCLNRFIDRPEGNPDVSVASIVFHTPQQSTSPDNKQDTPGDFREFVAIKLLSTPPSSTEAYAIRSFLTAVGNQKLKISAHPSEEEIRIWIASMYASGLAPASRTRYFRKLHALYLGYSGSSSPQSDPFISTRELVDIPVGKSCARHNDEALTRNIGRISALALNTPAAAAILYMLYAADFDLEHIINLKVDDEVPYVRQIHELLNRELLHHRQKYQFQLQQNRKRTPQLIRELSESMKSILSGFGMTISGTSIEEELKTIWITRALRSGVTFPEIRLAIPAIPSDYSWLTMVAPAILEEEEATDIVRLVADSINDTRPQWYAFKIRIGATPEEIEKNLSDKIPGYMRSIDFFNPTRRKARKEGKKIVFESIPVIPGILFFRTRSELLPAISAAAIEKAWIFRHRNTPDSPYSIIPRSDMHIFQKAIGEFTPDMEVEIVERQPLEKGRKVRITAGDMAGYEGTIFDIKDAAGCNTGIRIFTIDLSAQNSMRWKMSIEEVFIEPIE